MTGPQICVGGHELGVVGGSDHPRPGRRGLGGRGSVTRLKSTGRGVVISMKKEYGVPLALHSVDTQLTVTMTHIHIAHTHTHLIANTHTSQTFSFQTLFGLL